MDGSFNCDEGHIFWLLVALVEEEGQGEMEDDEDGEDGGEGGLVGEVEGEGAAAEEEDFDDETAEFGQPLSGFGGDEGAPDEGHDQGQAEAEQEF